MRVSVDENLCSGCGPCSEICPEVFEIRDDVARVKVKGDVPADLEDGCREAAENCPPGAIIIRE